MSDHAAPSVPRSTGGTLGQGGRNGRFVPTADDLQGDLVAGLVAADAGAQLAVVGDRLAVDADQLFVWHDGVLVPTGARPARLDALPPEERRLLVDGKLPKNYKVRALPDKTIILRCGIDQRYCPAVNEAEPSRTYYYLMKFDINNKEEPVPEMTG